MSLRSPIPPAPPPSLRQRFVRSLKFYGLIAFIIVVWAGSSLFIAPIVQWTLDRVGDTVLKHTALTHEATFLDKTLSIPCNAFETLPTGCDGLETEGEVGYGPGSVLYFWGQMPNLDGLGTDQRRRGETPDASTDGVFYTLQKSFGRLPTGDAALTLARNEMGTYGAFTERRVSATLVLVEAAEGSARPDDFYAVYTRDDGVRIAAGCFGTTCKVPQAPWEGDLAYGLTINKRNVEQLPAIDTAVRDKLHSFVKPAA